MSSLKTNLSTGASTGKNYWRSLNEVSGSPEFAEYLNREFPEGADEFGGDETSRRDFMKIMAAGFAVAGAVTLTGCRRPEEKILPYGSNAPEEVVPGKSTYYATAYPRSNGSLGLLVKTHEGRPVKIDGNPEHPNNLGKTDSKAQAELLAMYDPERLQMPVFDKKADDEATFVNYNGEKHAIEAGEKASKAHVKANEAKLATKLAELAGTFATNGGEGVSILLQPTSSPSEIALIQDIKKKYPKVSFHVYEPVNDDNAAAALKAFTKGSKELQAVYNYEKANTVLALDSDFMLNETDAVRNSAGFAEGREVAQIKGGRKQAHSMNRLYSVESIFSLTGSNADHRLRLKSSQIESFLFAVAQGVLAKTKAPSALKAVVDKYDLSALKLDDVFSQQKNDKDEYVKFTVKNYIDAVVEDLLIDATSGKASLIVVGEKQNPAVHTLALVLNDVLGNFGKTVSLTEKVNYTEGLQAESITLLNNALKAGTVKNLLILGGNPVYDAPADLKFGEQIAKAGQSLHLSLYYNETSAKATVVAPKSHFLEAWGDTRSFDGTLTLQQPMIAPLYNGVSELELLATVFKAETNAMKLVQKTNALSGKQWQAALYKGFVAGTAAKAEKVAINLDVVKNILSTTKAVSIDGYEVVITPHNQIYDGSFNNNGWLQELPDPITKLTWDNAALMSMATAAGLGLDTNQALDEKAVIKITVDGQTVETAYNVVPGMADKTIHLQLGYGREVVGFVGQGSGNNVYKVKTTKAPYIAAATVEKTSKTSMLVSTQDHWAMENRDLIKTATLDEFKKDNTFAEEKYDTRPMSLFGNREELAPENQVKTGSQWTADNQWAMVIDLNQCNGCSACSIACQAENNIPTVGKERVLQGREMHWIRMDRYFYSGSVIDNMMAQSDYENYDTEVEIAHQGVPCMQCENAPCEQVCPVAATVHTEEGLNDMVYNRCIGTRYCLNNCPFKVRRFNYFNFQEDFKNPKFEVKKMVHNPNVTVRSRGVMEKCTYCVQRINEAKIDAKVKNNGNLATDSFTTACAQVCPTNAITFGNQNDEKSAVSAKQKDARNYMLLPEYNVRPRTTFLAKLSNKNSKLVVTTAKAAH